MLAQQSQQYVEENAQLTKMIGYYKTMIRDFEKKQVDKKRKKPEQSINREDSPRSQPRQLTTTLNFQIGMAYDDANRTIAGERIDNETFINLNSSILQLMVTPITSGRSLPMIDEYQKVLE